MTLSIESVLSRGSMFYFNMEPRLIWNKIILAAEIILFHFRRHVWNEIKIVLAAKKFYFISDTAPNFRPISIVAKRLDGSRCYLVWR